MIQLLGTAALAQNQETSACLGAAHWAGAFNELLSMLAQPLAAPSPAWPSAGGSREPEQNGDSNPALDQAENKSLSAAGQPQVAYPPAWATADPGSKKAMAGAISSKQAALQPASEPVSPNAGGSKGEFRNAQALRGSRPASAAGEKTRITVARGVLTQAASRTPQYSRPGSSQLALALAVPTRLQPNAGELGGTSGRRSRTAKESQDPPAAIGADRSANLTVRATVAQFATVDETGPQTAKFALHAAAPFIAATTAAQPDALRDAMAGIAAPSPPSLTASTNPSAPRSATAPFAGSAGETHIDAGTPVVPAPATGRALRQATASDRGKAPSSFAAETRRSATVAITPQPDNAPSNPLSVAACTISKTAKQAGPQPSAFIEISRTAASSTQGASPIAFSHLPPKPAPAAAMAGNTGVSPIAQAADATEAARQTPASGIRMASSNVVAGNSRSARAVESGSAITHLEPASAAPGIATTTRQAEPLADALAGPAGDVDSSLAASPTQSAPPPALGRYESNPTLPSETANDPDPMAAAPSATRAVGEATAPDITRTLSVFVADKPAVAVLTSGPAIAPVEPAFRTPGIAPTTTHQAEPLTDAVAASSPSLTASPRQNVAPVASSSMAASRALRLVFTPYESNWASPAEIGSDEGSEIIATAPVATAAVRETTQPDITRAASNFLLSNRVSAIAVASGPALTALGAAFVAAANIGESSDKPSPENQDTPRTRLDFNLQPQATDSRGEPALGNSLSPHSTDPGSQPMATPFAVPAAPPGSLAPLRPVKDESPARPVRLRSGASGAKQEAGTDAVGQPDLPETADWKTPPVNCSVADSPSAEGAGPRNELVEREPAPQATARTKRTVQDSATLPSDLAADCSPSQPPSSPAATAFAPAADHPAAVNAAVSPQPGAGESGGSMARIAGAPDSGCGDAGSPAHPAPPAAAGLRQDWVPVPGARVLERMGQAELRLGVNTAGFGNVEVRTTVADSHVAATVLTGHGELRSAMLAEMPSLQEAMEQHHLRLERFDFNSQTGSGNHGSATERQAKQESGIGADPGSFGMRAHLMAEEIPVPAWGASSIINVHA